MKRILIVDDHPAVLEGLSHLFSTRGYKVVEASSVKEAATKATQYMPIDVMIVDLTLHEDGDGLAMVKRLRRSGLRVPVVIYTMHEELWNISLLINSDIDGIVLKGEKIEELIEAVRQVSEGGRYRSPVFLKRLEIMEAGTGILSQKDIEILNLISNGINTAEISEKVCLTQKAVEYHRSNIIKKLGAKNMTESIKNAVKLGIISCLVVIPAFSSHAQEATAAPEAVDLGLSVKWADRNLGAPSPLEAGGYYAFGETAVKEEYSWATYVNCDDGDMYLQHDLGESICGTKYDAARVILGEEWRMPTLAEAEELIAKCSVEFVAATDDVLAYARIKGENDAYIDVPLVGYMSNSNLQRLNKQTSLPTGNLTTETEEEEGVVYRLNAPYLIGICPPDDFLIIETAAHLGFNIRPVYVGKTVGVEAIGAERTLNTIYSIDGRDMGTDASRLPQGLYIFQHSDGTATRHLIK